jgi:protein TonB
MMRKPRFTIYHGLAASIAIHSALGLPVVYYAFARTPEELPPLVVELQGLVAETQSEEKVVQETKGQMAAPAPSPVAETPPVQPDPEKAPPPPEAQAAPPPEPEAETPQQAQEAPQPKQSEAPQPKEAQTPLPEAPQPRQAEAPRLESAKTQTNSTAPGAANVKGDEEAQKAQAIKLAEEEADRLRKYVKGLTKSVQSNLRYPDEGRRVGMRGAATVSFTILPNGQIWPGSLKIVESSGQPKLDASALQAVRSSVPFESPPQEMTVAIAVVFGRKH